MHAAFTTLVTRPPELSPICLEHHVNKASDFQLTPCGAGPGADAQLYSKSVQIKNGTVHLVRIILSGQVKVSGGVNGSVGGAASWKAWTLANRVIESRLEVHELPS